MTPEQILTLIAAVGGPLSGVLIAVISNRRSRQQINHENDVAKATVRVDEKDAHTREIAMILDGYTAVNTALNKSLERTETGLHDCSEKFEELEARFEEYERRSQAERLEMIEHIKRLEQLIPYPPGPPERPAWG